MSRWRWLPAATTLAVVAGGELAAQSADQGTRERPWLEEVAVPSFVHARAEEIRYRLPEIMSGGAAWLDYDGDGDLDLYLVQGGVLSSIDRSQGPANRLWRNDAGRFVDATDRAGVGDRSYGIGAAVGDYDADGDVDLFVTNVGSDVLYRNRGDGTFDDATQAAGVGDPGWGSSAAFVDGDGDDWLDLFVVRYIQWSEDNEIDCFGPGGARDYCHPDRYNAPAPDLLYRNRGGGTFADASTSAGLDRAFGNGLGVGVSDFDGDHDPDLYVANDGMANQLWLNRDDGTFVDEALLSGCAFNLAGEPEASMGVALGALSDEATTYLFLTHLRDETNTLYRIRDLVCEDVTATAGLAAPSLNRTGFGVGFVDFDHDGRLDVYVANGRVGRGESALRADDPFAEPNQLFRGLGDGRFEELPPAAQGEPPRIENSRAAAFGDFDGDGAVDVAVVNNGGPARLLRNRAGEAGAWLMVRGVRVARSGAVSDAYGARVRVVAGELRQWRDLQPAYGYASSNDPRTHFGLGTARRVDEISVLWPDGRRTILKDLPVSRVVELRLSPRPLAGR